MKKIAFILLIGVVVIGMVLGGCGEPEETTAATTEPTMTTTTEPVETKILRLAHPLPDFDPMVQSAIEWADNFNAGARGLYKMEVHAGGVLGGMVECFDMVRTGALAMSDFSPDFIGGKDLVFVAQGLPFSLKTPQAAIEFLELIREALWQDILRDKYNLELLALSRVPPHDWAGTKPIYTLEDWDGITIWVSGPTEAAAVEALGASPVTLDWNDGYPAIEKGTVDGGIYGEFAAWMLKWEACKYMTIADAFISTAAIVMNKDMLDEMPADIRELMIKEGKAHQERTTQIFLDIMETARTELLAAGVEIYVLPADEKERWKEATSSVADEYYAQLDPADAALIKSLFTEANE